MKYLEHLKHIGYYEVNTQTSNKLVKKWETTGLLKDLNENQKIELSILLDAAVIELTVRESNISDNNTNNKFLLADLLIPITCRLYRMNCQITNIPWLADDLEKWVKKFNKGLANLKIRFDMEQEICERYCQEVFNDFKRNIQ